MRVEIEATGKAALVAIFHECELAVILFEKITQQRRPEGTSWQDAWAAIEEHAPDCAPDFKRAAKAAMQYFATQVGLAGRDPDQPVQ